VDCFLAETSPSPTKDLVAYCCNEPKRPDLRVYFSPQALAAGVTQSDLDGLNSDAGTAAASDPIEHQEWNGGDSYVGLVDLIAAMPLPPDFTASLSAGGDIHVLFWHYAFDVDSLQIGWDESSGNLSLGAGFQAGHGHGFGLEAGLGPTLEITNADHVDKLRAVGHVIGFNGPYFGLGAMSTDMFGPNFGPGTPWGMFVSSATLGFSFYEIETWSAGGSIDINF